MLNYQNVIYPENCRGIVDVTKAPLFLDNTGKEDCTEKLCDFLDDMLSTIIKQVKDLYAYLKDAPDGTRVGKNRRDGIDIYVIDLPDIPQFPTLYFPNGTYLISDTVTYRLKELHNTMHMQTSGGHEMNQCIRFMGQNKEKTILKLKDHCKGFEYGQRRPVVNFMHGERSNVSYSNFFENITIDTGVGNPGAVGLVFFANNNGAVRNVTIRSSDPDHAGAIGILINAEHHSACNFYDVEVDGFEYGVRITTFRTSCHFENLTLKNQGRYGFQISNTSAQIIGLKSYNRVPAICASNGIGGHLVVTDAELVGDGTGYDAIKIDVGCCAFLRNIHISGYAYGMNLHWRETMLPCGYIDEFCYPEAHTLFDDDTKSVNLQVPHTPDLPRAPLEDWCCVNDFGAVGDGETDDTAALQAAFDSGKKVVWFQPGIYLVSKPICIPATVEHVHFMFCEMGATDELRFNDAEGIFRICGESDTPLLLEKMMSWHRCQGTAKMFRHDSRRNLIIRDVHSQAVASYFNTVPGAEVHLENVACTIFDKTKYSHIPCFSFRGQTVWCHSINPERSKIEVENIGGQLWWSGFKTEQEGSICITSEGGVSEIMGGSAGIGTGNKDIALIVNDNSTVSASFTCNAIHYYSSYPLAVREIRNGEVKEIYDYQLPQRLNPWYTCPLYVGKCK